MKVTVWEYPAYDLVSSAEEYNILAFKKNVLDFIQKSEIKVGDWNFIPGNAYKKIGIRRKTSSGYVYYDGEPLIYCGYYDGYILFTKDGNPLKYKDYIALFYAYRVVSNDALFTLNRAGSGRILEMN